MTRISFKGKPRKEGSGLFTLDGEDRIFIGKDWALQNEIDEAREKTRSRACFKECRTCGACSNSRRDASYPFQFDANEAKLVSCRGCERFRFHDCHNGWMRDSRGDAEPFTEDAQKLFKEGGKPLI